MIILDLNLPGLSGFDVLERNPRKQTPVVAFSASMNKFDVERTLLLGAREYIHKPMNMREYRNAILSMVYNRALPGEHASGAYMA
jgi:DNA-binding response OmpR family regulator